MRAMEIRAGLRVEQEGRSPFLAKTGTYRTGDSEIPGYYCEHEHMWVVETKSGPLPIIDDQALYQCHTESKTGEVNTPLALELMTKTSQQLEGDDDRAYYPNSLLQLLTKTETVQESDDNFNSCHMLELLTKTKVQQEADDDGFQALGFGN